jgi:hypothetical protein
MRSPHPESHTELSMSRVFQQAQLSTDSHNRVTHIALHALGFARGRHPHDAQPFGAGLRPRRPSALQRAGELIRLRRGAYAFEDKPDQLLEERHRRLVWATAPQLGDGAVFSHGSAAVLHGLPVWSAAVDRVHVTRDRRGSGARRSVVHVHGAPLAASEIILIDCMPVTSLSRTVLDLARTLPMTQAVAAGDRGLTLGLRRHELDAELARMKRWARDPRGLAGDRVPRCPQRECRRVSEPGTTDGGRASPARAPARDFRARWEIHRPCRLLLAGAPDGGRVRRKNQIRTASQTRAANRGPDLPGETAGGRRT